MRTNKPDKHHAGGVTHSHNQPAIIALDVEHHALVRQKAGVPMRCLDVRITLDSVQFLYRKKGWNYVHRKPTTELLA